MTNNLEMPTHPPLRPALCRKFRTWERTHEDHCRDFQEHDESTEEALKEVQGLAAKYDLAVIEEQETPPNEREVANVGKMDAKKHLDQHMHALMAANVVQAMATMLDTVVF